MFTALDAEHCCACPLPDTAHKDGCSVTLWAENERLRAALEEAHYGINDYLQEFGESEGKLTEILREIDNARASDG